MKDTMTIRLPPKLRKELRAASREERVSVSDLVRDSLRRALALRRFERDRAMIVPRARARGFFTDEDIFRVMT